MSFYLCGTPGEQLRLKSFSSVSRGGKCTIRIEIETTSPYHMGFALDELARVQAGQRLAVAKPGKNSEAERLALPAPDGSP